MYMNQKKLLLFPLLGVMILLLFGCATIPTATVDTAISDNQNSPDVAAENQVSDEGIMKEPAQEGQSNAAGDDEVQAVKEKAMTVYKSPTCDCCQKWVEIMEAEGFTVVTEDVVDMSFVRAEHGVQPNLQSCHTAIVDGYVIEGHVPADAIQQLLAERPAVTGLAVPGMPVGSPGMEVDGYGVEPFTVIAFDATGGTEAFASYPE